MKTSIFLVFLFCTASLVSGLEPGIPGNGFYVKSLYIENPTAKSGASYSFFLPDSVLSLAGTSLPQGNFSSYTGWNDPLPGTVTPLAVFRPSKDRETLLKNLKNWSWTTIISSGINFSIIGITLIAEQPEIGALSIISHAWFGFSNIFLGNAYYALNQSLNTYGPEGKNPHFGMWAAYGAFIFTGIGVAIGATMFDGGPRPVSILSTVTAAGIANLLGISSFVYYILYDKSAVYL